MDDLVQWLRSQLDEDERTARTACEYAEAEWRLDEDGETVLWWPPEPHIAEKEREKGLPVVSDHWRGQTISPGGTRIAPHIAEHDPARVLREIDAKRQMLARVVNHANLMGRDEIHGDLLRLLALPYADRPGYRKEWRP
ncbi:DUF6221 family protein [Streptomyces pactum]|uniref:Uncharacterized protein n=1 Tax=Streptomyces pactum TaxID=68249 RepID=A0A1S6JGG9_9ACTN|nr:DUF6221 family protein [Streptomyces pactum]AQS70861.1 hypothetical protein B1H29_31775 [Streptomyces pactum]